MENRPPITPIISQLYCASHGEPLLGASESLVGTGESIAENECEQQRHIIHSSASIEVPPAERQSAIWI